MENKKDNDSFRRYVEKLTTPIFNKVLQETKSHSMTTINNFSFLWQPHNYRLKIPISYENLKIKKVLFSRVKYTKRTNKYTIKNFKGLTVEINPTCIIIIYSSKKWYKLEGSMPEVNAKLLYLIKEVENKCIRKAKEIAKIYNFRAYYKEKNWVRHEDGIEGDDFIDSLPRSLIVNTKKWKKVYPNKVEFKSPFDMVNYLNNRAIDMVAPQIVESLNDNTNQLKEWTKAVNLEIHNKQLHMKVLNDMSNTLKNIDSNLLRVKYEGRRLSGLERRILK